MAKVTLGRSYPQAEPRRSRRFASCVTSSASRSRFRSSRHDMRKPREMIEARPKSSDRRPSMTRIALYARCSSDSQREASIEDQFRICREHAKRENWKVVSAYKDAGISGASMILRPGIQMLLQDAQRGQFDVVLAEALDRISPDQA